MRCTSPIKAAYRFDGTLTYKQLTSSPELTGLELPCRKCLACRLSTAREKAIRCWHESQMWDNSIFLTLTYDDAHLRSPRLDYSDFQDFMKSLRAHVGHTPESRIGVMVTGEYGEQTKRPHWHAILFNYRPADATHKYTSHSGDSVYSSQEIDSLWEKGATEFGTVTIDSSSYVARYAAKKLVHGPDQSHDFHPIHRTSSKHAIGKAWIEKYWESTFALGYVYLPNGSKAGIPRYYKDWLKEQNPAAYLRYVTNVLPKTTALAEEAAKQDELEFLKDLRDVPRPSVGVHPVRRSKVKDTILKSKFKQLQEHLKL